jgi:transcriptional regulator with XRE-family HTH domain
MSRKRVTLKDVAERSGVTPTMVSAVLNNRKGRICCSPERREKILQAARELNYHPNVLARSMTGRTVPLVGIMLHLHEDDFRDGMNDYFLSVLPETTFRLNRSNLEVLFIPYSDENEQIRRLDHLIGNNLIGGVITNIVPGSYNRIAEYLRQTDLPYMIQGRPVSDALYCSYIVNDIPAILRDFVDIGRFKKIYSVTSFDGKLHFTLYPFPCRHHWLAPQQTPSAAEHSSGDTLFLAMGNSIHKLLSDHEITVRNEIIVEAPERESAIPPGIPYLLVDSIPSRRQLADYVTTCLAEWMQKGILPPEKIHIIECRREDARIKWSGTDKQQPTRRISS